MNDYIDELLNGETIKNDIPDIKDYNRFNFNCGGYALGTLNWYRPYDKDGESGKIFHELRNMYDEDTWEGTYDKLCDAQADNMIEFMRNDIKGLEEIARIEDCPADKRVVVFRASYNDFHYIRQLSDGSWSQKCGVLEITAWSKRQVFSDDWRCDCDYRGRHRILAVPKEIVA